MKPKMRTIAAAALAAALLAAASADANGWRGSFRGGGFHSFRGSGCCFRGPGFFPWFGFGGPVFAPGFFVGPPVVYAPPPVFFAQPPVFFLDPAANSAPPPPHRCFAGAFICPLDRPGPVGAPCSCPTNTTRAAGQIG
jgi:hypothetical protein